MEWLLNALYNNRPLKYFGAGAFRSAKLHRWVERFADSPYSGFLAGYLAGRYRINMDESEFPLDAYHSLNSFFTRRLRPGIRPFSDDPLCFSSPADSMLSVRENICINEKICIKGIEFSLDKLLGGIVNPQEFSGGTIFVSRLYVPDCHRLYFPCDGKIECIRRISGDYYSVTPRKGNLISHYELNQRWISRFASDYFGELVFVDIGGFLISSVKFSADEGNRVKRGQEKSIFRFGGSTLVTLIKAKKALLLPEFSEAASEDREIRTIIGQNLAFAAG